MNSEQKTIDEPAQRDRIPVSSGVGDLRGEPGAGFLPTWARRTVSPLGVVTDPNGATDMWSFPVLPKEPVRVGSSWKRPIKCRIAYNTPNALASGVCEYRLAALGSYQGRQVAKIEFSISAKMPKRDLVLQQVIGVKSVKPVPEKGTHIGEVVPGFPAQRAGILPGDVVIQVGDMPTYSFSDLVFAVAASPAGEPVRMLLVRKGEKVELSVTPLAVKSGSLAIDAQAGGILVFDVYRETVLRTETRRVVVNMLWAVDGKELHQRIQGSFVIQTREGMKAEQ